MAPRRKGSRKASRKGKRASRRNNMMGGWQLLSPAGVNDKTMMSPSSMSLAQGRDYDKIHMGQHGGAYTPMSGAPLGATGMLDASLRESARLPDIDASIQEIQGMSDQSGGARRKSKRSGSKRSGSKRSGSKRRGSKRSGSKRRGSRRNMHGGNVAMRPAEFQGSTMLLPPALESKALMTMNQEWKLAENPTSFAPHLAK